MVVAFDQFAGNSKTLGAAKEMLIAHRVPQALLLEGPTGSGRTTLALLLAGGLLCAEDLPCGGCPVCNKVFAGNHPDVAVVNPQKDKTAISVDQIRQVRADAFVKPGEGSCKVFVLRGLMNDAAQNALLKILEEPPKGVYFILIGEHRGQYMETVLSRVSVLSLQGILYEEALPVLAREQYPTDETTKERFETGGCVLGTLLGANDRLQLAKEIALRLGEAVAKGSRTDFLKAAVPGVENRTLFAPVLSQLVGLLHDALWVTTGQPVDNPVAELLARRYTRERLTAMAKAITQKQEALIYNPNGWLFFTGLCAQLLPYQ